MRTFADGHTDPSRAHGRQCWCMFLLTSQATRPDGTLMIDGVIDGLDAA